MRISTIVTTLLFLLGLSSCGGGRKALFLEQPAPRNQPAVPAPAGLDQLPDFPAGGHFMPQRAVSQLLVSQTGDKAVKSANASIAAPVLALNAPGNAVAYALYRFDGIPGEGLGAVSFNGTNLGTGTAWLAMADYSTQRWSFFPPQSTAAATFDLTSAPAGTYVSPGGDVYVLVVVFDGDSLTVNDLAINYLNRYTVSGTIRDNLGSPIPGAVVSTPLSQLQTTTDAAGHFTLGGFPEGSWPLIATKSSWTFYSNPAFVEIDGADKANVEFLGHQNGSHYLPGDLLDQDDGTPLPALVDLSGGGLSGSLSIVDDQEDNYRFSVAAPGAYYVEIRNPDGGILFPYAEIRDALGYMQQFSYYVLRGDVRLGFSVVNAPAVMDLRLGLSGGGGEYDLALHAGTVNALHASVLTASDMTGKPIGNCIITAEPASGGSTDYLTNQNGSIDDAGRLPELTTVSAFAADYGFSPQSVDMGAGDQSVTFIHPTENFPDSFEPNDSFAEADGQGSLPLPYNSATFAQPLSLVGVNTADQLDLYQIRPAAGNGLRVRLRAADADGDTSALRLTLYDSSEQPVGTAQRTADGLLFLMPEPVSDSRYYIEVAAADTYRRFAYQLEVESFAPHQLTLAVLLDEDPVAGARIDLRDENFTWKLELTTDSAGEAQLALPAGMVVYAELLHFGFDSNRHTRRILMGTEDLRVTFTADPQLSLDPNEPNQDIFSASRTYTPLNTHGILHPLYDDTDVYRLFIPPQQCAEVTLDFVDPRASIPVKLYSQIGMLLDSGVARSGVPLHLKVAGQAGPQWLMLNDDGYPVEYQLRVKSMSAGELAGSATIDGLHGADGGRVYCPELDRYLETTEWGGTFNFGPVPPGAYTLQAFAPGYFPQAVSLNVTTAGTRHDFALLANTFDAGEPDNSLATAQLLPVDGSLSSWRSTGLAGDPGDHYKIPVTKGQLYEFTVEWDTPWHSSPVCRLMDNAGFPVNTLAGLNASLLTMTGVAKKNGLMYLWVFGGPAEYAVRARVIDAP